MKRLSVLALGLLFVVACATTGSIGDRPAITDAVYKQAGIARSAWELKDARMLLGPQSDSYVVKLSDGKSVSGADVVAELQRQMNETKKVTGLNVHVDAITFNGDTASVVSTQTLTRIVNDGRTQITTTKQRQQFKKVNGAWQPDNSVEQLTANVAWAGGPKA